MRKEYQDLIKTDAQDLLKLNDQVEKVERLKKQYNLQKQQIGSLKNTIHELQSENQQLKSREKFQSTEKNQRYSVESISDGNEKPNIHKPSQGRNNGKKFFGQVSEQEPSAVQMKTNPKIWNQSIQRPRKYQENLLRVDGLCDQGYQRRQCPQPSLRNHSGFISSTRKFVSPKVHTRQETWQLKSDLDNQSDQSEKQLKIDIQHMETKKHLYGNLIADLRAEMQSLDKKLGIERAEHKRTRKQLKKQRQNSLKLSEANNKIYANYEILERENYYLKDQLVKQTESKIRSENLNNELILWYNTTAKSIYEEFQLEFIAMDNIYYEFERAHARARSHLTK